MKISLLKSTPVILECGDLELMIENFKFAGGHVVHIYVKGAETGHTFQHHHTINDNHIVFVGPSPAKITEGYELEILPPNQEVS